MGGKLFLRSFLLCLGRGERADKKIGGARGSGLGHEVRVRNAMFAVRCKLYQLLSRSHSRRSVNLPHFLPSQLVGCGGGGGYDPEYQLTSTRPFRPPFSAPSI